MNFINGILDFYNHHKEQIVVYYLAGQTVLKAVQDSLAANRDKSGLEKWLGVFSSILSYLGLGKRS